MSKLVFKAADVKQVVEHAITTEGQLLLAHDQGVYLMSNGQPLDKVDDTKNFVVYAEGCNPEVSAEWYDTAHSLVGGDDFAAELPFLEAIKEQIDSGVQEITLKFEANSIELMKGSILRKCSLCGRLLKKNYEGSLCPKCVEQGLEKTEEDETPKNDEAAKVDEIKPGNLIRKVFLKLVEQGKVTDLVIASLTSEEATKRDLGIRYPFLKEYDPSVSIKELTYIKGHSRYSSKIYEINGKQYLITNDLYKKNVERFVMWIESFK